MDILELKKTKQGYRYCLVVVDSFSKWCESFALKTQEASEIAKVLYNEVFCRFGCPRSILSDRGQNFCSKLIQELCKYFNITRVLTSSYHPQTNSQVERMNKVIVQALKIYCDQNQENWPDLLPSIMLAYRASPNLSTSLSPFFMLFGRQMQIPIDTALIPADQHLQPNVQAHLQKIMHNHQLASEIAQENLAQAQAKYKKQYDKKTADRRFDVGQSVWLYCSKTPVGLKAKCHRHWLGPYYVAQAFPKHTYKLIRSKDNRPVKSAIHSNRIKAYIDPNERPTNCPDIYRDINVNLNPEQFDNDATEHDDAQTQQQREAINDKNDNRLPNPPDKGQTEPKVFEVDKLLRSKMIKGKRHYYVKWSEKQYKPTWEPIENIPDGLIKEFHINKTLSGRKKRKRIYPKP